MDSCSGDSGGPLFSRAKSGKKSDPLFLTGIVSYGTNLCGVGVPGVQSIDNLVKPLIMFGVLRHALTLPVTRVQFLAGATYFHLLEHSPAF